tara:strand:+ start:1923 stop:2165 length:243 start_codon:yes stop_codon:yes gene_type:complete
LVLGCSAKIHLVVSREMNWAVVETVFKAMVALGAVTFFVVSKAGGPEEVVEQAIQLAEFDPLGCWFIHSVLWLRLLLFMP